MTPLFSDDLSQFFRVEPPCFMLEKEHVFHGKTTICNGKTQIFHGKTTIFHGKHHIFHGKTHFFPPFFPAFSQVTEDGSVPLHLAAHFGHRTALQQLLHARCRADAARGDGATALHLAAEAGQLEIVKMLLEAGSGWFIYIYWGFP